jgi:recombinational DNA repair ATPase RecF
MLQSGEQSFVTATDWTDFPDSFQQQAQCYTVTEGRLEKAVPVQN